MNRAELILESSMLNWFPKVKTILPVPRTVLLRLSDKEHDQICGMLDGKPLPAATKSQLIAHARQIGFPLFLRSDIGSGKHDWKNTCFVPREEDLLSHIAALVEWHFCCDFLGMDFSGLAFRELLPLESEFTAFPGDLPISVERRYFVDDGKIICHHPYWPADAIRQGSRNTPEGWEARLARMNIEPPEEVELILGMARTFAECLPGYWSVDFAKSKNTTMGNRGWYLIDAGRGEISWHPDDCPFTSQGNR